MNTLLNTLRGELATNADPVWKAGAERYFKEPVKFYGMSNSAARKIGREFFKQLKGHTREEILELCEELMQKGLMEETIIACDWSNRLHRQFVPGGFEIASLLLHDPDDPVQKGYGWMLKAAAESHCREVFEFVLRRIATMPRTALRYAIEKMPAEMKAEAMKK